jgi:hypothetical protein
MSSLCDDNMKRPNCACQKCVFNGICSFNSSASIFILNIASKDLGSFPRGLKLILIYDFYSKMKEKGISACAECSKLVLLALK